MNTIEIAKSEAHVTCRCKGPTVRVTFGCSKGQAFRRCETCRQTQALDVTIGAARTVKDWRAWWAVVDAK